jgi:hypothetical protein
MYKFKPTDKWIKDSIKREDETKDIGAGDVLPYKSINSWIGKLIKFLAKENKYRILKKNEKYYLQYRHNLFWNYYKIEDMVLGPRYCHLLDYDNKRRMYTKYKYSAIRFLYIIDYSTVINKKLYIQDCNKYSLMFKNLFSNWFK